MHKTSLLSFQNYQNWEESEEKQGEKEWNNSDIISDTNVLNWIDEVMLVCCITGVLLENTVVSAERVSK